MNKALFERSTEVVDASFAASFSMNCFGLGAPKRNLDMVGFLGCCGSRAAVVCVALGSRVRRAGCWEAGWIYVLWLLLLVGAEAVAVLIDAYVEMLCETRRQL